MGKLIKTQLPNAKDLTPKANGDTQVWKKDVESKFKGKTYIDQKPRAKVNDFRVGENLL